MKILFVGGNGNISYHCVLAAVSAGHEVTVVARGETSKTRKAIPAGASVIKHDYRDEVGFKQLLQGLEFDVVMDFLCYTAEDAERAVRLFGSCVGQYIFISSVTVYERPAKLPFVETSPRWSNTDYDYALDKQTAEMIFLQAYRDIGFPVTIVRPAHTYDTIVPVALGHNCFTVPERYLQGEPVLIAGDGTNLWTLTHSRDFASALMGLAGNRRAIGEDFHITGDEWLSWLDITRCLLDALGLNVHESEWIHIPLADILAIELPPSKNMAISFLGRAFAGQRMWCDLYDNRKIKDFVPGWSAQTVFADGIRETVDWLREDPVRCRINSDLWSLLDNLTQRYG